MPTKPGSLPDRPEKLEPRGAEQALRQNEQLFRVVFEQAAVGIGRVGLDGRFLQVNQRYGEILGYTVDELVAMTFQELTWPEDLEKDLSQLRALLAGAIETYSMEKRYVRKDGRPVWVALTVSLGRSDDGQPAYCVAVVQDIDERKRAERELQESNQQLRLALDSAEMGTWSADPSIGNVYWDRRSAEMFGLPELREVSYLRCLDRVHTDDRALVDQAIGEALDPRSDGKYEIEIRTLGSDGAWHWIRAKGQAHFEGEGPARRGVRVAGTHMDVTERKHAEEALKESQRALQAANERLVDADRRKNEFLAVLSHELRNPLAPIRNSVYVLERATPGGPQAERARAVIGRQVHHMARLIDDLLDVTRISRGKITLQPELLELNGLVSRTAEDYRDLFDDGGIELHVRTADRPLWVRGDRTRLAQVIGNLLGNAAKFTRRGDVAELTVGADGSRTGIVEVRDNGAGIPPATLEHLFQPFVQAESTLDRSAGGLGLGLALVKALVEMHGGRVEATSGGPGHGAEFVVRLPLQPAAAEPGGRRPDARLPKTARRVLVIEDNRDAAESLKEALELVGDHEVELATDGLEGVEKARSFRPDVVLCDLGLPGIDGYEVARRLRAEPSLASTHLIALSGYALAEDVERAKEAGFADHLAKPTPLDLLEARLAGVGR